MSGGDMTGTCAGGVICLVENGQVVRAGQGQLIVREPARMIAATLQMPLYIPLNSARASQW